MESFMLGETWEPGGKAWWQDQEASWSHWTYTQEAKRRQQVESGSKMPKPNYSDTLPPLRLYFLNSTTSWGPTVQMHEASGCFSFRPQQEHFMHAKITQEKEISINSL